MTGTAFVMFAFLSPNCQPTGGSTGGDNGNGGNGSGGDGGNNSSNGGSSSSNGGSNSSNGGSNSSNGGSNSSNGGSSSKGGTPSNGGSSASNGGSSASNGGSSASNGGSSASNGGTPSNGGSTSTSTSTTPTGTTVAFGAGKGQGAMTGYGFVALGSADTLTSPTCGPTKAAITSTTPCAADPNWSNPSAICMSGSIPALPAAPTATDYSSNWGASVGLNATDPAGGGLGQSFTSVTITVTGAPTSGLRAIVHKKGDPDSTSYCFALTSGTAIPITSFVTDCYNTVPSGTKIAASDTIDKISVQVSSGPAAIAITDLCITAIAFAK
jgi:hypothetical protein